MNTSLSTVNNKYGNVGMIEGSGGAHGDKKKKRKRLKSLQLLSML